MERKKKGLWLVLTMKQRAFNTETVQFVCFSELSGILNRTISIKKDNVLFYPIDRFTISETK